MPDGSLTLTDPSTGESHVVRYSGAPPSEDELSDIADQVFSKKAQPASMPQAKMAPATKGSPAVVAGTISADTRPEWQKSLGGVIAQVAGAPASYNKIAQGITTSVYDNPKNASEWLQNLPVSIIGNAGKALMTMNPFGLAAQAADVGQNTFGNLRQAQTLREMGNGGGNQGAVESLLSALGVGAPTSLVGQRIQDAQSNPNEPLARQYEAKARAEAGQAIAGLVPLAGDIQKGFATGAQQGALAGGQAFGQSVLQRAINDPGSFILDAVAARGLAHGANLALKESAPRPSFAEVPNLQEASRAIPEAPRAAEAPAEAVAPIPVATTEAPLPTTETPTKKRGKKGVAVAPEGAVSAPAEGVAPVEAPLPPESPVARPLETMGADALPVEKAATEAAPAIAEEPTRGITMAAQEAAAREIGYDLPERAEFSQSHKDVLDNAIANRDTLQAHIDTLNPDADVLPSREHRAVAAIAQSEANARVKSLIDEQTTAPEAWTPEKQAALDQATADVSRYGRLLYRSGSEAGRNLAFQRFNTNDLDAGHVLGEVESAIGPLSPEARQSIATLSVAAQNAKDSAMAPLEAAVAPITKAQAREILFGTASNAPEGSSARASRKVSSASFGEDNVLFTRDKLNAALETLRKSQGTTLASVGLPPPEVVKALVDIGGYYVEGGVRRFGAWASQMRGTVDEKLTDETLQHVWDTIHAQARATRTLENLGTSGKPKRDLVLDAATLEFAKGAQSLGAMARSLRERYGMHFDDAELKNLFDEAAKRYQSDFGELEQIKQQLREAVQDQVRQAYPNLGFEDLSRTPKLNGEAILRSFRDGRYRNSYAFGQNVGDALNFLAAAEDAAKLEAHHGGYLHDEAALEAKAEQEVQARAQLASNAILGVKDASGNPLATRLPGILDKPKSVTFNGRQYAASVVNLLDADGKGHQYIVPREVAIDYNEASGHARVAKGQDNGILNALAWLRDTLTSAQLFTPAEFVAHGRREVNLAAAIPPIGSPAWVRAAEAAVPYLGPRVGFMMRLISQDMSLPENQQILREIVDANAGSSRAFTHNIDNSASLIARIPKVGPKAAEVIRKPSDFSHRVLFGIPEGKGLVGFDLRTRVLMEKIRRAYEGNNDPKRIREFANQFGQYTQHPDIVVEKVRQINPFAATSLPMRLAEQRQLFGQTGLKSKTPIQAAALTGETLLRHSVLPLLTLAVLNRQLSGKWPWENESNHLLDVNAGNDEDGQPIYLPSSLLLPTLARAMRDNGMIELYKTLSDGETGAKPLLNAEMRSGTNAVLGSISGPPTNAMTTGLFGHAPYITHGGRPLNTVEPEDVEQYGDAVARALAVMKQSNSLVETALGHGRSGPIQAPAWRIAGKIGEVAGGGPIKDKR